MPFLSKDWRSPGEEWVRYEGGWEKRKTVVSVPGSDSETANRVSNYSCTTLLLCNFPMYHIDQLMLSLVNKDKVVQA